MKILTLALLALLSEALLVAQDAPQSIADSLVYATGGVSVFRNDQLILFRADGTYQVMFSGAVLNSAVGYQTLPPTSGTYTYTTTPSQSGLSGTITLTSAPSSQQSVILIGFTDNYEYPTVGIVYPRNALTGAVNVSNNCWVSSTHTAISGFVIQGNSPRWVLVRGDGPSLSQFGVLNPVNNPVVTLSSTSPSANGNGILSPTINLKAAATTATQGNGAFTVNPWATDPNLEVGLQTAFSLAGAFQFPGGSGDCAALVLVQPGSYIVTSSPNGGEGELLTEVYVLPYGG